MEKKPNILKTLDVFFVTTLMLAVFIDVMLQIISRLAPGNAISWTVEMGEILLAGIIWMGIGLGVLSNTHVRFDLLLTKLSPKTKKIFYVVGNIVFAMFLLLLAFYTIRLLSFYIRSNTRTPSLRWNKAFIRWPVLVGCVVGALRLSIQAWFFATGKEPIPGNTEVEEARALAEAELRAGREE